MKRIIRKMASNAYLTADGTWADYAHAYLFKDVTEALLAIQSIKEAVEMVLMFGTKPSQRYDIVLPLSQVQGFA